MITLFQFPSPWKEIPAVSPFSLQVETYLRMAGLPYEVHFVSDPRESPKGQLPYIVDHKRTVGDTTLIIEHLKRQYGDLLDGRLTRAQVHQRIFLERVFEGSLLWAMIYSRWVDERGWRAMERELATCLPSEIRHVIPRLLRVRVCRGLEHTGHGRGVDPIAIYAKSAQDLQTLADALMTRTYFLGSEPTSIDAMAFAVLASIFFAPIESELKLELRQYPVLQDYCRRMVAQFFPDEHFRSESTKLAPVART